MRRAGRGRAWGAGAAAGAGRDFAAHDPSASVRVSEASRSAARRAGGLPEAAQGGAAAASAARPARDGALPRTRLRRARAALAPRARDAAGRRLLRGDAARVLSLRRRARAGAAAPFDAYGSFAALIECVANGSQAQACDALEQCLGACFDAGAVTAAALAASQRQARDMWALREGLAIDALPHLLNFDMSLPMAGLDTFAACCDAALRAHGPHAACLCVGMPATATCTSACRSPICPRTARTASSALSTGSCARWADR